MTEITKHMTCSFSIFLKYAQIFLNLTAWVKFVKLLFKTEQKEIIPLPRSN